MSQIVKPKILETGPPARARKGLLKRGRGEALEHSLSIAR
jgi:hypothetical protein